jgi:hypothetical protein
MASVTTRSPVSSSRYTTCAAARERQEHPAGELEGVVQRQHRQHPVALRQREHRREGREQRGEVAVGEHHALGRARGARGVDDAREAVGRGTDLRGASGRLRRRRSWRSSASTSSAGPGVREPLGHLLVDDKGRARDARSMLPRGSGSEGRVDGHGDRARAQNAEVRDGPVGVVGPRRAPRGRRARPRRRRGARRRHPERRFHLAVGDRATPSRSMRRRAAWWTWRSAASSRRSRRLT